MKRVTLTVAVVLLAVPALAWAKTGIGFQTDPADFKPGERQQFQVALFHEPPGPSGRARPYGSHGRPLVTFTSVSGRVMRIRARPLMSGVSRGMVTFPDKGPWTTTISLGGHRIQDGEHSGRFIVGTALSDAAATPAPARPPEAAHSGDGFPWVPVLPGAMALAAAAVVLALRRRRPRAMGAGGGA